MSKSADRKVRNQEPETEIEKLDLPKKAVTPEKEEPLRFEEPEKERKDAPDFQAEMMQSINKLGSMVQALGKKIDRQDQKIQAQELQLKKMETKANEESGGSSALDELKAFIKEMKASPEAAAEPEPEPEPEKTEATEASEPNPEPDLAPAEETEGYINFGPYAEIVRKKVYDLPDGFHQLFSGFDQKNECWCAPNLTASAAKQAGKGVYEPFYFWVKDGHITRPLNAMEVAKFIP